MHPILVIAAGLTVLLALAHSIIGERLVFRRLVTRQEPGRLERMPERHFAALRTTWHLTSLFGLGLAALMYELAGDAEPAARWLVIITALFLVSAVYWIWGTRGRHPGWIVMLMIALCTGWQLALS